MRGSRISSALKEKKQMFEGKKLKIKANTTEKTREMQTYFR